MYDRNWFRKVPPIILNFCSDGTTLDTWSNAMPHHWKVLHNSCLEIQSQIQMVLANILYLVICLFVDVFMSDFFSHMEKWRTANFDLCSVIIAIEQWGFFSVHVPQTVKRGIRIYCSSPKARDTHTYCRALSSGAVTTRF